MLFNRFVYTCMILVNLILRSSSGFYATSEALFTWAFCCNYLHLLILWSTLMLTGLLVRIHASPPRAMPCFSVTISSPGPPSVRTPSQGPVLKLSIAQWLMVSLRPAGCASSSRSTTPLYSALHWCIVTTTARSTCPPTRFRIGTLSTSRLISTSSGSGLQLVTFVSFMSRLHLNMRTSSPKASLLRFSRSSGPV